MQIREEYCTISRQIKYVEVKFRKPHTNLVNQQQTNVSTLERTDKIPLEKVTIEENLEEYHHTEGSCPLLDDPWLYLDIGDFGEGPHVEDIIDISCV